MFKAILLALAAGTALVPAIAAAQPGPMVAHAGASRHGGSAMSFGTTARRFNRGFIFPTSWLRPEYFVSDWRAFGLSQPRRGHRWMRYWDGAYLVDSRGRVVEARHDMRWSRRGGSWDQYAGGRCRDSRDGYRDRRRGDEYDEGCDYRDDYDDRDDYYDRRRGTGPRSGYGYDEECGCGFEGNEGYGRGGGYGSGSYGYGSGYGYGAPIIVETTVTTEAESEAEAEVIEEVIEYRTAPRRVRRAPPRPRPPAGERG